MNPLKVRLLRSSLDAMYATCVHRLLERRWQGAGSILMLHRVRPPDACQGFAPNRYLEVSPDFLETVLCLVKALGRDVIGLDEVPDRLAGAHARPFVCFTFDDGYRDVFDHAYPIFRRHGAPFTVYVQTGMPDGTALLWWDLIEEVVRRAGELSLHTGQGTLRLRTRSSRDKRTAFRRAYWALRGMDETRRTDLVLRLCEAHAIDPFAYCRASAMTWDMLRQISDSGLGSIEAHTVHHPVLSKLGADAVEEEAERSRHIIGERLGRLPRHFAYPYGDRESAGPREFAIVERLGFRTATTTRRGTVFPAHAGHLHALPRVSLNGDYQARHYVRLLLSGAPFAFWQRFRRLDVA